MIEEQKKKDRTQSLDNRERVALSESNLLKVNEWLKQLGERPGVTANRKQIVNWLIETHPAALSSTEQEALSSRFYDEVKFLSHALTTLREAKARGETLGLADVLGIRACPKPKKARTPKATVKPLDLNKDEPK